MAIKGRTPAGTGSIEVITGSMFSGKSEELIRRVRRAQIAKQTVQLFKPKVDARYSADEIVSHSDMKMPSQVVASAGEILAAVGPDTDVVAIDEGQFFDAAIVEVANKLANEGRRVIVAGLDQDYRGPTVRADAAAHGRGGVRGQDARHLHALRGSREPHAAARGAERSGGGGRRPRVRGAVPILLRSGLGDVTIRDSFLWNDDRRGSLVYSVNAVESVANDACRDQARVLHLI